VHGSWRALSILSFLQLTEQPFCLSPWCLRLQVVGLGGELLLVSQFTLYGRLRKPKPDYSRAMGPDQVIIAYYIMDSVSYNPFHTI
jgi:D-tyrosyl-tRNA(Tyr) deacylase